MGVLICGNIGLGMSSLTLLKAFIGLGRKAELLELLLS